MKNGTLYLPGKVFPVIALSLVLVIGAAGSVRAATISSGLAHHVFDQYDANQDGVVSIKEALAMGMLTKAFETADANHDGNLNQNEFAKAELVDEHLKQTSFIDDSVLTAKVKTRLLENSVLKDLQVNVEACKGVVELSGFVDTRNKQLASAQIATAVEIAAGVEGVNKVINNLIQVG